MGFQIVIEEFELAFLTVYKLIIIYELSCKKALKICENI